MICGGSAGCIFVISHPSAGCIFVISAAFSPWFLSPARLYSCGIVENSAWRVYFRDPSGALHLPLHQAARAGSIYVISSKPFTSHSPGVRVGVYLRDLSRLGSRLERLDFITRNGVGRHKARTRSTEKDFPGAVYGLKRWRQRPGENAGVLSGRVGAAHPPDTLTGPD